MAPQVGRIFEHKHYLHYCTNKPVMCKITAVRGGRVYFRPFFGVHEDGTDWLGASSFLTVTRWQEDYS